MKRVIPDYAFDLYFPEAARAPVLAALSRLCTPASVIAIASARARAEDTFDVTLVLPSDAALGTWREENPIMHDGVASDEVHVGVLAVSIHVEPDTRMRITLWPPTRRMQIACFDSPTFRRSLVRLLVENDGIAGYVDKGDGSTIALWPRDERDP
jgi:hypothetical protein